MQAQNRVYKTLPFEGSKALFSTVMVKNITARRYYHPTSDLTQVDPVLYSGYSLRQSVQYVWHQGITSRCKPNGLGTCVCRLLMIVTVVIATDCSCRDWLPSSPLRNRYPFLKTLRCSADRPGFWMARVIPVFQDRYRTLHSHQLQ
jgi:hypothetical protein